MPDSSGPMAHDRSDARYEETLETILRYFSKMQHDKQWSYGQLHDAFFIGRVAPNSLKNYLRYGPPASPRPGTVTAFRAAYRQAQIQTCPDFGNHEFTLNKVGCADPSPKVFARYEGGYDTWRIGRTGLVCGRLRIGRHEVSGTPYHWQEHERVMNAETQEKVLFKYEGPVYFLARTVHLRGFGDGSIRDTKCLGTHDPRRKVWRGIYLSEEWIDNNPFAAKILFLHDDWLKENGHLVTDAWLLATLASGTPRAKDSGPHAIFM